MIKLPSTATPAETVLNPSIIYDRDKALEAGQQGRYSIKYAHNQTPEVCLAAVRQDPDWRIKMLESRADI